MLPGAERNHAAQSSGAAGVNVCDGQRRAEGRKRHTLWGGEAGAELHGQRLRVEKVLESTGISPTILRRIKVERPALP